MALTAHLPCCRSVATDSLLLNGVQHDRLPCPSLSPGFCLNSYPLSWWHYATISSSVSPFSSPQSFPTSGSFPTSWLFAPGGQSIGTSVSLLPMNIQDWFPSGWTGLISLQSKGLSRVFSSTTIWKYQFFSSQPSLWSNTHICTWLLEKTIALTVQTFVSKMMSLLLNTLSKFVIAFLPSSKHLLISCLQSRSTVILEPKIWGHFSGNGNGMIYDKERCTWFITKDFNFHFITLYSVNIYIQSLIKYDLSKLRSVSI